MTEKEPLSEKKPVKSSGKKKIVVTNCETCLYYDYDDDFEGYICTVSLDEDELERFIHGQAQNCPYYRFYDEYKSVQKQN